MAISYGTRTALANISRLHSSTNTQAKTFGEIDNSSAGAHGHNIHLIIPINSSATGGTYDLYLVESQDGTEWTDGIDPTTETGDVAGKIKDATWLYSADATYNASNRTQAEFHIHIPSISKAAYLGFVVVNNSGQTIPASGADGDSVAYTVS
jgi:hypothetical protein